MYDQPRSNGRNPVHWLMKISFFWLSPGRTCHALRLSLNDVRWLVCLSTVAKFGTATFLKVPAPKNRWSSNGVARWIFFLPDILVCLPWCTCLHTFGSTTETFKFLHQGCRGIMVPFEKVLAESQVCPLCGLTILALSIGSRSYAPAADLWSNHICSCFGNRQMKGRLWRLLFCLKICCHSVWQTCDFCGSSSMELTCC